MKQLMEKLPYVLIAVSAVALVVSLYFYFDWGSLSNLFATIPWMTIVYVAVIGGVGYSVYRFRSKLGFIKKIKPHWTKAEKRGFYFNIIEWNLIIRPIASLVAGVFLTALLVSVDFYFDIHFFNWLIFGGLSLLLAIFFAQDETETETVPEAHGAMLTFWGKRFRIYREEGDYTWTGKKLGIGRSRTVHLRSDGTPSEGINKDGFIRLTQFPFAVWNQANEQNVVNLISHASDASEINSTLTLTMELHDPMQWLNSEKPALDLAEQARTAYRTTISFFIGLDAVLVKSIIATLMQGYTVISVFLPKNVGDNPKGTIIKDHGGGPLLKLVSPEDIDQERQEVHGELESDKQVLDRLKLAFAEEVQDELDEEVKRACTKNGKLHVEAKTVERSFRDVLGRLGAKLVKAAVGNINLSDKVTEEANKAASEGLQRIGQIASAKTVAASMGIIDEAAKKASDLAAAIAAGQDNPRVKTVVVGGGGDSLKSAAAVHATLSNDNGGTE